MDTTTHTIQVELWDGYSQDFVLKRPTLTQAQEIFKVVEMIGDRNLDNRSIDQLSKIDLVLSLIESPDAVSAREILESIAFLPKQLLVELTKLEEKGEITVEKQDLKNIVYKVILDGKEYLLSCRRLPSKSFHLITNQDSEKAMQHMTEQFLLSLNDQSSREAYGEIVKMAPFAILTLANRLMEAAIAKVHSEKKRQ